MFELKFSTANEAFEYLETETARILRYLARKIEREGDVTKCGKIRDINGNTIGSWKLS